MHWMALVGRRRGGGGASLGPASVPDGGAARPRRVGPLAPRQMPHGICELGARTSGAPCAPPTRLAPQKNNWPLQRHSLPVTIGGTKEFRNRHFVISDPSEPPPPGQAFD